MLSKLATILLSAPLLLSAQPDFTKDVKPLFGKYCNSCHGPEKQKAKLRMDQLNPDMVKGIDGEMWQEVLDLINISDMPPKKADAQPTRAERQVMVDWLTAELRRAVESQRSTGGKNIMRRMTAYEYNNTMRDLLGLDLEFAEDLPPEGSAKEGFKNNNTVLTTSALHIEYFENIARQGLEKALLFPDKKPPIMSLVANAADFKLSLPKTKGKKSKKSKKSKSKEQEDNIPKNLTELVPNEQYAGSIGLIKKGAFKGKTNAQVKDAEVVKGKGIILAGELKKQTGSSKGKKKKRTNVVTETPEMRFVFTNVPTETPLTIRVKAAAIPGKSGAYPELSTEIGAFMGGNQVNLEEVGNIVVRASMNRPQIYEFRIRPENFPFVPNKAGKDQHIKISNVFKRGTSTLVYKELPKLFIESVEVRFNDYKSWPPEQYKTILFDSKNKRNERVYIREVLTNFMRKAYRRQVAKSEVELYARLFEKLRPIENSFESTVVSTLSAVLCSSNFLYFMEPNEKDNKRKLNDYELASRLSYFLWSSMPDSRLFSLATKRQLSNSKVLQTEVKRMIKDPRSSQFVKHFSSQWLDLEGIRKIAVNPEYFDFKEDMKDEFEEETVQFVNEVFKKNLSITNFIDSEFAMLSPRLAKHYNIPGVAGGKFAAVPLDKKHHRGGVLTHASVMLGNSAGGDTHPIKRGVWLLERIMNDPAPPPPPNVPELPEEEESEHGPMSLKEKLQKHANTESCADCHAKIDPWGVAFENYNALGQWREGSTDPNAIGEHRKVISDPVTELKNGRKIENLDDLKNYIIGERREQFLKAVINKVMSYGLGRYVEFTDQQTIDQIARTVNKDDYKFQTLVEQVVLSEPFLTK